MGLQYLSEESSAPTSPASGQVVLYPKTDHFLYWKDSTGTVRTVIQTTGTLTSGRVPYATTSGVLTDDANLTYNGTTFTIGSSKFTVIAATGLVSIGTSTSGAGLGFNVGLTVDVTGYSGQEGMVLKIGAAGGDAIIVWNADTTGNNNFISFYTEGGTGTFRGSIDYNRAGGAVRYNTTSNAELKNIFGDADPEISKAILRSTRIAEFEWKDNIGKRQIGVIAQEVLASGFTGAVSLDDEGTPVLIDKTAWNFHLIAGWKAHDKDLESIKAKLGMA